MIRIHPLGEAMWRSIAIAESVRRLPPEEMALGLGRVLSALNFRISNLETRSLFSGWPLSEWPFKK